MLKKDYSPVKQSKPEYKVREDVRLQKRKSFFKKMVLFFSILFLIIFIIHSLFFASFFKIKKVVITGLNLEEEKEAEKITQDFFDYESYLIFSQQNIFFLNQTALKNTLGRRFDLETVNLRIKLPDTLEINIKKNEPILIWQSGQKYYAVYQNGELMRDLSNINGYELPLVKPATSTEIILGQKYLTEQQIIFIKKIFSLFNIYFKNQQIDYFEIASQDSKDIKLVVKEKWYLLFNLDFDAEESLKLVSRVITEKIKETKNLEYIDARVKDRIYYK